MNVYEYVEIHAEVVVVSWRWQLRMIIDMHDDMRSLSY